jgi:hypothetical protein
MKNKEIYEQMEKSLSKYVEKLNFEELKSKY